MIMVLTWNFQIHNARHNVAMGGIRGIRQIIGIVVTENTSDLKATKMEIDE